jgi:hypothetical protein
MARQAKAIPAFSPPSQEASRNVRGRQRAFERRELPCLDTHRPRWNGDKFPIPATDAVSSQFLPAVCGHCKAAPQVRQREKLHRLAGDLMMRPLFHHQPARNDRFADVFANGWARQSPAAVFSRLCPGGQRSARPTFGYNSKPRPRLVDRRRQKFQSETVTFKHINERGVELLAVGQHLRHELHALSFPCPLTSLLSQLRRVAPELKRDGVVIVHDRLLANPVG